MIMYGTIKIVLGYLGNYIPSLLTSKQCHQSLVSWEIFPLKMKFIRHFILESEVFEVCPGESAQFMLDLNKLPDVLNNFCQG